MEKPLRGYLAESNVAGVAALLRGGGVAVLPTDTIYGLHCAASDAAAVRRIRKIKGRGSGSAFILLVSDMEMADRVVARWPRGARELLSRIWPAPLTAILPASEGIDAAPASKGTVAVRIPALRELRRCIERVGCPLVSTSVNPSGQKPLTKMSEIRREVPGLDAYISQRGRPASKPSTIVDMTAAPPRLVRQGRFSWPAG
ncbi:MAG TPA: threonylcarbamoyl-AMP synthase [Candidatus Eisenbacteria bacterium]|uniref:L-threonylcarbamoyladenylate synthase n=1 Tax=Eiseniibacteriota bacterium TaxID=2212470 RepID=A0A7V2ATD4_UNCEI|nr:threonylcarbamoyl-AMP synthase [Candidatus Eisenbacteria bacterium]